jgi:hypothetical protein
MNAGTNSFREQPRCSLRIGALITCSVFIIVLGSSCTTKNKAREQSRAAYHAGRAAAYQQALENQRTSIRVVGNVRNPEIPWSEGLSLMEALIAADYVGAGNPREIIVIRGGEAIPIRMKAFLDGEDVLLQRGDGIEIR